MKQINPPIERIYKTKAYDKLEAMCNDDEGGDSCFMMCDKFDRQAVVNLLIPIIRKEERDRLLVENKNHIVHKDKKVKRNNEEK